jgi:acetyl-CoA C-acetyltransferase
MTQDIVIVSAARTAVGKFGGSLAKISAPDLGAIVIREAISRSGLSFDQIGEVIMGQVLAAGAGPKPRAPSHDEGRCGQRNPRLDH